MGSAQRVFRIFVSSTFTDLSAERDALQREVFPAIRDHCARAGYGFQAIDLRWGIGQEASLDQRTMRICLDELARCQRISPRPNFLVLLGDRYGWRPLPEEIDAAEFAQVTASLSADDRALAERWYARDDNALPPVHRLQPRTGEAEDWQVWAGIEHTLRPALERAARAAGLGAEALVKYSASATEQEIVHGALEVPGAAQHVFCFLRNLTNEPTADAAALYADLMPDGSPDIEAREALTALKDHLRAALPDHAYEYPVAWAGTAPSTDHIAILCADVRAALTSVIDAEIATLEAVPPLERERAAHAAFAKERSSGFVGRVEYLRRIADYLAGDSGSPLVIYGEGGSGKSALLAEAVGGLGSDTGGLFVQRYVGATPSSADVRALLTDLCAELGDAPGSAEPPPTDYNELAAEFRARVSAAAESGRRVTIVLDSLDQLSTAHGAHSLAWLPTALPAGVRLVLSTRPGEQLATLRRAVPEDHIVRLQEMRADEGAELLDAWLDNTGQTLTPEQREEVLSSFAKCGLPLHLRLAFEEASRWASYDPPVALGDSVAAIIADLYDRLEGDHGSALVGHALAYLSLTRETAGLGEDELLDALSRDETVYAEFLGRAAHTPPEPRIPVVIWARLYADLEPYLTSRESEGTQLLTFYHRELAEEARVRYADPRAPVLHSTLAAVFGALGDPDQDRSWRGKPRALAELPYHLTGAEDWGALFTTLTDFAFLEKKAAQVGVVVNTDSEGNDATVYTGVYALLDDYERALEVYPNE